MNASKAATPSDGLPIRSSLSPLYVSSLAIALIMLFAAVVGLVYQRLFYASNVLRIAFAPSDAFGLLIALPVLLGSMWLARRGRLIGLLSWPGTLFYVLYAFVPYMIAVPFNVLFLPHLILAVLSAYSLIGLVAAIDGEAVGKRLAGFVPIRATAIIIAGLGVLILSRQTVLILGALASQASVGILERATWIADFMIAPMLLAGGIQLWRRQPLGYASGAGLLLGYAMLALGLVPFFVLQSRISGQPIDGGGALVVLVMAALCLVPFAFFVRAARGQAAS